MLYTAKAKTISVRKNIHQECAETLDEREYNNARLVPSYNHELYAHLADLKEALDLIATNEEVAVLDYGCGGSPYRKLFPNATYHRSDFTPVPGLDFRIAEDSRLDAVNDKVYDLVLSTQVLEHVASPATYLSEACRVLRPGGTLALTTHGCFWDHGCPYDYRRWTVDGLKLELQQAGFSSVDAFKLTTNARAALLFADRYLSGLYASRLTKEGFFLWVLRELFWRKREMRNSWADRRFAGNRVVKADEPGHELYIAILAIARKT